MTGADYLVFRLEPHDDLKKKIEAITRESNIQAGAIISCVGSLEQVHLRFANQNIGTKRQGFHEILSLTGTVSVEGVHLHMAVADTNGRVTGGHLLDENLIYTTAEITLAVFTDIIFRREIDPTYGYRELVIQKKT
jgi:hypothetical protein